MNLLHAFIIYIIHFDCHTSLSLNFHLNIRKLFVRTIPTPYTVDFHTRSLQLILQMVIRCCRVAVRRPPPPSSNIAGSLLLLGRRLGLPSIFNAVFLFQLPAPQKSPGSAWFIKHIALNTCLLKDQASCHTTHNKQATRTWLKSLTLLPVYQLIEVLLKLQYGQVSGPYNFFHKGKIS